jgi:hypothetical protein
VIEVCVRGRSVCLGPEDFVGAGGEGEVYARDGVAYKLGPVDEARFHAAAGVRAPGAVMPRELLTVGGAVAGFTMPLVADAAPLCRLFCRSYARRNPFDPLDVAQSLSTTLRALHAQGVAVVDLHEMNVLHNAAGTHVIDAMGWQFPGFPATALMDHVRDRQATVYGPASDWFSYALLVFQLFVGIHPYRGAHTKSLDARMRTQHSVLRGDVVVPPVCRPLSVLPWRSWFEAVLERGERCPPPGGGPRVVDWNRPPVAPQCVALSAPLPPLHLGLCTPRGRPAPGPLYALQGDAILRRVAHDIGSKVLVTHEVVARVLRHATKLFDGVSVSDVRGAAWVTLLPGGMRALPELDGAVVLDAVARGCVLAVLTRTERLVFRFGARDYDVRRGTGDSLSLVVTPGRIAALLDGQTLELFDADPGDARVRTIDEPALLGGRLVDRGGVALEREGVVRSITLVPPRTPPAVTGRQRARHASGERR